MTDKTLLSRLHQQHEKNADYLKPKGDMSTTFGIRHFAGVVFYDCKGFIEKNKDSFSGDLLALMPTTKNKFLNTLFIDYLKIMGKEQNKKTLATLFSQKSFDLLMKTLGGCNTFFIKCIGPNELKKPLVSNIL